MNGREVVVGVCGGVAAYKTAALVSRLVQGGTSVSVVMTAAAEHFIGPATLAALTGRPVECDMFDPRHPLGAHIELAQRGELLCIAPATADFLAKAAHGIADDLLSTLYLAFEGPVMMAPTMNNAMWQRPVVQRNVEQLRADGVELVGPDSGWLSCRVSGTGRMAEADAIFEAIRARLEGRR
jgi:phosphopantothenoylcysteine synthetase/decarboxylase